MTAPTSPLRARLAALPDRLRAETATALAAVGDAAVAEARRLLATSRGPLPSSPGEPPRDRSGHLAGSLSATVDEAGAVTLAATDPARHLEFGTRTMEARPFLRPAAAATEPIAREVLRAALARAARAGGDP